MLQSFPSSQMNDDFEKLSMTPVVNWGESKRERDRERPFKKIQV